ncbi:hypothetical protein CSB45_01040 [candidate division KSB3 bacterium]|uniref:GerMN domain-containing protein n=1 Tax=candidate division KSB3 bacterium TaxID=2044937 RepID=A0A2G6EB92_9BACT|nr:MAG: hypothetical protein CSB45_01040 [candidate division KSB3 bacterium]PIE30811.1 MAG: hypothetical protein CSA57_02310 [candidate division KSB3 bacterium]
MSKIWIALVVLSLLLLGSAWFLYTYSPQQELERALVNATHQQIAAETTETQEAPYRDVTLFTGDAEHGILVRKARTIERDPDVLNEIQQTISLLIQPDENARNEVIPEGTTVLNVFLSKEGIAYLNLSRHVQVRHIGGLSAELTTIASFVNTLLLNFQEVKQVQILVEGAEIETLTGHVDCRKPFSKLLLVES